MNEPSKKFGSYTIAEELGRGAFAEVHSATDAKGKECAVKIIYKKQTENLDLPDTREKALAEIDMLSKIDHIFILKFMDSFKDPQSGRWCIVTELCNGDLRQRLNEKKKHNEPFEEDQILDWFTMLTSALDYLHDEKFIHRDLKPENVLFCDNDLLKLSDFGLAKFLIESASGTLCGSLSYMAPEVRNEQPYGSKCDIWSLGVLIYELCCLKRDVRKTDRKIPNIKYSDDLKHTVRSMLEEEPQERPAAKTLLQMQLLKDRLQHIQSRSAEKAFSFLEGVNSVTVSLIQIEEDVFDMVYSQSSGLIYVVVPFSISGFKWDENNKTFKKLFETSIENTTYLPIDAIALAPQDTSGGDQIYISVGWEDEMKNVYRLGGRKFEKRVLLPDTSYIDDECWCWLLASNTDRDILLIHPYRTPFIYIHLKEQKHGKVDLNQLNIPKCAGLRRIELIGQLLVLGEWNGSKVYMCELIVTESDAFIKSGSERGPIECDYGYFAALSHVVGDEDEQLHLFTVSYCKDKNCTDISEYKFNISVSGSELNQLPMQPKHTLEVKGEFRLHCLVNVNSHPVLMIGRNDTLFAGNLSAIELLKEQVKHHVQLSNS